MSWSSVAAEGVGPTYRIIVQSDGTIKHQTIQKSAQEKLAPLLRDEALVKLLEKFNGCPEHLKKLLEVGLERDNLNTRISKLGPLPGDEQLKQQINEKFIQG